MSTERPSARRAEEDWSTPQVVELLGISRQAVNKRVQARTLLGYRDGRSTRFPSWQFDPETGQPVPEVAELLTAFGEAVGPRDADRWLRTKHPELGVPPLTLLLAPDTKQTVLDLARKAAPTDVPAAGCDTAPSRSPLLERIRAQVGGDDMNAQTAILLAAAELFAWKGPAQVSLRSVAAAADVPYSLIYRYYGTKDSLLASVMALIVTHSGRFLYDQPDAYSAIANSFGVDSGQWGRMVSWAILDDVPPTRLFRGELRSGGYRKQIETLWENPSPPRVRRNFDPRVLASLIQLVGACWAAHEPYLSKLAGDDMPDPAAQTAEVIEMLQMLAYACRPQDDGGDAAGSRT